MGRKPVQPGGLAEVRRCPWCGDDPLYRAYHDEEWGVPVHDERRLFEFLLLEGAQAGLSWITILRKRAHYRRVFDGFDPELMARYDARRVTKILRDPGIVRNRLKVEAAVVNARSFLGVRGRTGGFHDLIWGTVGLVPKQNAWRSPSQVPAQTTESDALSKALRQVGFKFVGSTICYAFMQAVGMVNDHVVGCFRHREIRGMRLSGGA